MHRRRFLTLASAALTHTAWPLAAPRAAGPRMRAFAAYFREAAGVVFGREVPHTLLTHFNLISALYLGDLLDALRSDGWSFVAAADAYEDDVFRRQPLVLPGGDSLVIACAREAGRKLPQAPVENDEWLSKEFERLRT